MSVQIERRWFSVSEYERMIESGILSEDDRLELIEGDIVKMSPIGRSRAGFLVSSATVDTASKPM